MRRAKRMPAIGRAEPDTATPQFLEYRPLAAKQINLPYSRRLDSSKSRMLRSTL